jgi:hypothetical protein
VKYWWVNQNKTHEQEQTGGYLWSPKTNSKGAYNQFYENLKYVASGDLVFCYWDGALRAYGIAQAPYHEARRPAEFGEAGNAWDENGYRINVAFRPIDPPVQPKAHFDAIGPLLPEKYSPLHRPTGRGLQAVYLAHLPDPLGVLLLSLVEGRDDIIEAATTQGEATSAPEVSTARVALAELAGRRAQGQGFGLSPDERKAVEARAMEVAAKYYEDEGWIVEDVHKTRSYDLIIQRNGEEVHVEVKGTTGLGQKILLPKNEVAHARRQHPNTALFVVHGIKLDGGNPPIATGGTVWLLCPWDVDQGQLEPLAYSYVLPKP